MITEKQLKKAKQVIKLHEEQVKSESYAMFEQAGCQSCKKGQLENTTYSLGNAIYHYERCSCSFIKTKRYKEYLETRETLNVKDRLWEDHCYYDNNSNIKTGNTYQNDRSW